MAGVGSRRQCDRLIAAGRVEVNGEKVSGAGTRLDPTADTVRVDGREVLPARSQVNIILNKPRGMVVTLRDQGGKQTVAPILEEIPERVFPVGRLDKESEGLLLLTNDGELAHRVTHPRFGLPKIYHVTVSGEFTEADVGRLKKGVLLSEGMTRPLSATLTRSDPSQSEVEIVLGRGRKREIRRMFSRLGFEVRSLVRVGLGPLRLGSLRPGAWRPLDPKETRNLRRVLGLEDAGSDQQPGTE